MICLLLLQVEDLRFDGQRGGSCVEGQQVDMEEAVSGNVMSKKADVWEEESMNEVEVRS